MKLKRIAELVSGELKGEGELDIRSVANLNTASPGDLVFVFEEKYLEEAIKSKADALIAPAGAKTKGKPAVLVKNPRLAMADLLAYFAPKTKPFSGIHKSAVIAASAKIGKRVTIYPFVSVGEHCQIGDDSIIYPSVTLYDRVKIGRRVIIHAGARIGVDGFGFVWDGSRHKKIPQIGEVIIGDDVEIYANVTVARGTLGPTRIGKGTKIDCLSHIAHNCELGENCALVSLIGLAGSVVIKDHVYVGGQAGFSGHNTIGENSIIMARSGITKDVAPNSVVSGFPAQEHSKEMRLQSSLRRLAKKYLKES